jgi:hypothetical protein
MDAEEIKESMLGVFFLDLVCMTLDLKCMKKFMINRLLKMKNPTNEVAKRM